MEDENYVMDQISRMKQKSSQSLKSNIASAESLLNEIHSPETGRRPREGRCEADALEWRLPNVFNEEMVCSNGGSGVPTGLRK